MAISNGQSPSSALSSSTLWLTSENCLVVVGITLLPNYLEKVVFEAVVRLSSKLGGVHFLWEGVTFFSKDCSFNFCTDSSANSSALFDFKVIDLTTCGAEDLKTIFAIFILIGTFLTPEIWFWFSSCSFSLFCLRIGDVGKNLVFSNQLNLLV